MLERSLIQLTSAQLIRPLSEEEPAFLFKHVVTQEAAYESILLKTRRELHRRVALAFEQLYPDHLDEYAATLAWHYGEAGDAAARAYANVPAVAQYERPIRRLEPFRETELQPPRLCKKRSSIST